jgi:hypothetical protein
MYNLISWEYFNLKIIISYDRKLKELKILKLWGTTMPFTKVNIRVPVDHFTSIFGIHQSNVGYKMDSKYIPIARCPGDISELYQGKVL